MIQLQNKLNTNIREQQLTSHYQEYNGSNIDMAGLKTRLNISRLVLYVLLSTTFRYNNVLLLVG